MKIGDKVTSRLSLWVGDIGEVFGIVDNLVHVIFPENDKHYAYQQTFTDENQLNIVAKDLSTNIKIIE